jgi:hypothetical protein
MSQALKRADGGARVLSASKAQQEEEARREEQTRVQREIQASQRRVEESLLPAHDDDFESLFGDNHDVEDLIHA